MDEDNKSQDKSQEMENILHEYLNGLEELRKKRNEGLKKIFQDFDDRKKEEIRKKITNL